MAQTSKVGSHATQINKADGVTSVRYHATDVVRFSGTHVELNSNGWLTATTKLRMNQTSNQFGLGFRVFQADWDWYVQLPSGKVVQYRDGLKFTRRWDCSCDELGISCEYDEVLS